VSERGIRLRVQLDVCPQRDPELYAALIGVGKHQRARRLGQLAIGGVLIRGEARASTLARGLDGESAPSPTAENLPPTQPSPSAEAKQTVASSQLKQAVWDDALLELD
jgi:hypothetical protein